MPDFDANDDPNGLGLAVAHPATRRDSSSSVSASTATSPPAPGQRPIAARTSSPGTQFSAGPGAVLARRGPVLLRYLDVVLVLLAAAPALALGAPVVGYTVGAGAWVLQRMVAHADQRWIRNAAEPRTQLGLILFEAFGRIWLLAGAIVVAGVAGTRQDGLAAALTIFGAYSVALVIRVLSGPPGRKATS